jgi:methionyl-tRNA formyltransferase
MNYLIATTKSWNIENFQKLKKSDKINRWFMINKPDDLSADKLKKINPRYIFFPHWSWIIPSEIYENFECIVFHMTDLPYGRGGSPLQNLIVRGKTETKISALRVVEDLDAGPIYIKRELKLKGSATEIFRRFSEAAFLMIDDIIKNNPVTREQKGIPVIFKRRKPTESDISNLDTISKIYDYIRMLDAEGYPPAFLDKNKLKLEFRRAKVVKNEILAEVIIKIIE